MSIRPIDMQVNILKESDQIKNSEKDRLHQEGQTRFMPSNIKTENENKEKIQQSLESTFNKISDDKRNKQNQNQQEPKNENKEKQKNDQNDILDSKDPIRGTIIDIKS